MLLFYSRCSGKMGGITLECDKLKSGISAVLGNPRIKHFKDSIVIFLTSDFLSKF